MSEKDPLVREEHGRICEVYFVVLNEQSKRELAISADYECVFEKLSGAE